MLKAMPSPTGRNTERLYIIDRSRPRAAAAAAYDSATGLSDEAALQIVEFLRDKLSPEDHAAIAKILGADPDAAMDNTGLPRRFGMDTRRRPAMTSAQEADFAKRYPQAARIKVNP